MRKNADSLASYVHSVKDLNGPFEISRDIHNLLKNSFIENHLFSVAEKTIFKLKNKIRQTNYSEDPHLDNPAIIFSSGELINRSIHFDVDIHLKIPNNSSSFILATTSDFSIIAIDEIVVEIFRIDGLIDNNYYSPNKNAHLVFTERVVLKPGMAMNRSNSKEVYSVVSEGKMFLYCTFGTAYESYGLVFSKKTLELRATGCFEPLTSKSILYLELLENINSNHAADFAFDSINHPSPIVRWRSLSTLNKLKDPRTFVALESLCDDPVPFIAHAAKRAISKGK